MKDIEIVNPMEMEDDNLIKLQRLDGKHLLDEMYDAKIISKKIQ